jgi:hypothetical protein
MTAFQHPATMPVASIGLVDRSAYRLGSALVRWSTRRAEHAARRTAAHRTMQHVAAEAVAPELRHTVLAERRGRELAAVRAEAMLLPRR